MVEGRLPISGLVAAAGMLLGGCSEAPPVVLASEDGQTHLTVYGGMAAVDGLNDQAAIQAANIKRGLYAMVISTAKADGATLGAMNEQVRANVRDSLIQPVVSASKPLKIGGMDAMQFTAAGRPPDASVQVSYLYTTVESAKGFHQVVAWTATEDFDRLRPVLDQITGSFQSADGPARASTPSAAPRASPAPNGSAPPGNSGAASPPADSPGG